MCKEPGSYRNIEEFLDEFFPNDPGARERIKEGAKLLEEEEKAYAEEQSQLKRNSESEDPPPRGSNP